MLDSQLIQNLYNFIRENLQSQGIQSVHIFQFYFNFLLPTIFLSFSFDVFRNKSGSLSFIIFHHTTMGSICAKPQSSNNYQVSKNDKSSIGIPQAMNINGVQIITYDKIIAEMAREEKMNNQSRCLVMFVESHARIEENDFLATLGKNVGRKIREFVDVQELDVQDELKESRKRGELEQLSAQLAQNSFYKLLPISIVGFPFEKICLIKMNVWTGEWAELPQKKEQIERKLLKALAKLIDEKVEIIMVRDISNQFGIPFQITSKSLLLAVSAYKDDLLSMIVACQDQQSANGYQQILKQIIKKKETSQYSKTDSSRNVGDSSSAYF